MKSTTLSILACPSCKGDLEFLGDGNGHFASGTLSCSRCTKVYPIVDGIPHFIKLESMTGFNRRFAHLYDLFSWAYRPFIKVAFAVIGMTEEKGRREITDRLEPRGGKVLEVSIGPGNNLPFLVNRQDVGEIFGLDISMGQLKNCLRFSKKKNWDVDLFLGNSEQLPFRDDSFAGVFHIGGINFFNNKRAAIDEMIRVSKPGTRILIADETEKGAKSYEKFIPGFKGSSKAIREAIVPPVNLVPQEMLETRVFDAWNGWMYCLEFRKPEG